MSISTSLPDPVNVDNTPQPTGSRDGSPDGVDLPLVDLVAQAPLESHPQFRNWPPLHKRLEWAIEVGIALELSALQMAALKHVCYRAMRRKDCRAPGCYESAASIGKATGYHRNHVGRALAALVDNGLLTAIRRYSDSTIHRPTLADPSTLARCNPRLQMDATLGCTKPVEETGTLCAQGNESSDLSSDDAASCGMDGCPFPAQVCPMCGRQGTATMERRMVRDRTDWPSGYLFGMRS